MGFNLTRYIIICERENNFAGEGAVFHSLTLTFIYLKINYSCVSIVSYTIYYLLYICMLSRDYNMYRCDPVKLGVNLKGRSMGSYII